MGRIFDALQGFLDGEKLRYEVHPEATTLRFGFRTETHSWFCVAEVREAQDLVLFASTLPEPVAEPHRAAIAELLTRINSRLAVGNFEMDYATGDVRYRTSIDLEGSEVAPTLLRQLLRANLSTVARFVGAIERVARGELGPTEALATVPNG